MHLSPYDPHHPYPPEWVYEDMERSHRRKSLKRKLVLAAGAVGIVVVTFTTVAAYELITSSDAKMIAQAARDSSRATALDLSTKAKCDRLVSEARAVGDPMPPCAARLNDAAAPSADGSILKAGLGLAKEAVKASVAD